MLSSNGGQDGTRREEGGSLSSDSERDVVKVLRWLASTFESINELDEQGEPTNVVDGLFAIARAIEHLASATEDVRVGLDKVACAISDTKPP